MPLRGITVLEFAGLAPAPFCGMVLKDFGATVIRIDKVNSRSFVEDFLGSGKKSLAINLKHGKGLSIVKQLANRSDVVLEPFRKGVMEKLSLGPEVLCKTNPRLIYARLTGFGQDGPFSSMAGHDINYLSISGLLSLFGWRNKLPTPPSNLAADFGGGGLICALGIVMALFERTKSGKGQIIDCNMVEGVAYLGSWLTRSQDSSIWGNPRGQNILDGGTHFYDTYETKDGKFMAVGALEPQFYAELLRGLQLDDDELPQDDTENGRTKLTNIFKQKTQHEWCQIFNNTDACVTPVLSLSEAANHPHNQFRGSFEHTRSGCVASKPAPLLSRTPGVSSVNVGNPSIGQHTQEILRDLGYNTASINDLVKENVVEVFSNSKL